MLVEMITVEPLNRPPSDQPFCPFVERLSSFRGDFLYSVYTEILSACPLLGGLSFIGRLVLYWEVCPLLGGLSFIGRFVLYWEVCPLLSGLSFIGGLVLYWEVCPLSFSGCFTVSFLLYVFVVVAVSCYVAGSD